MLALLAICLDIPPPFRLSRTKTSYGFKNAVQGVGLAMLHRDKMAAAAAFGTRCKRNHRDRATGESRGGLKRVS